MPGKRPRAGQIRRTTSMSLFTPAAASAGPPPAPALFTPSMKICPISDDHMTHIQEPSGIVDQTSTISGGRDSYMSPPISTNHIEPSMPSSSKPNSKEPEPVPMPTLLISSAKLSFRNYEHHHHHDHDCNRGMTHDHFLDVCFLCRKRIGHGRDIFIYRGDSAFCSAECRHRQIVADEKIEKCRSVIGVSATGPVATSDPNETAMAA